MDSVTRFYASDFFHESSSPAENLKSKTSWHCPFHPIVPEITCLIGGAEQRAGGEGEDEIDQLQQEAVQVRLPPKTGTQCVSQSRNTN
jgi:hypothetical protein